MSYVHQKCNERYATDIARYTKTRKRKYTDMGAPFADDSPLHRYYALYTLRRSAISFCGLQKHAKIVVALLRSK